MTTTAPTAGTTTDAALSRLLDEAGVRDATARFADVATRGDVPGFAATWTHDGVFDIGEHVHAVGPVEIAATYRRLREGKEFFVQFAVQGPIQLDGNEATTSCLVHEAARGPGATYYRNHALTTDRLRRSTDGGWLFTHRAFHYLWLDTSPFGGDSVQLPEGLAGS